MYFPSSLVAVMATLTTAALGAPANIQARDDTGLTLQQQLELAGTAVDRLALLPDAQDFVYDFNAATEGITKGKGTHTFICPSHPNPNPPLTPPQAAEP